MIFDLYAVVSNFAVKFAHSLIKSFFLVFLIFVSLCVCKDFHWKNQSCRSKMGMTSHLYYAYDDFSFVIFFFFALESDDDVFDESDDEGSGSGFTSGSYVSSFFELSVDRVS